MSTVTVVTTKSERNGASEKPAPTIPQIIEDASSPESVDDLLDIFRHFKEAVTPDWTRDAESHAKLTALIEAFERGLDILKAEERGTAENLEEAEEKLGNRETLQKTVAKLIGLLANNSRDVTKRKLIILQNGLEKGVQVKTLELKFHTA